VRSDALNSRSAVESAIEKIRGAVPEASTLAERLAECTKSWFVAAKKSERAER
jgi:hypothetical protein